jgi:hypothetical protein
VELCTEGLTDWGRNGHECLRELEERVAQADAEARSREQRAQARGRAVETIGEYPSDPIRRHVLDRRTLKLPIRLGQGRGTGLLRVPQMPEHAATDDRGEVHLLGETAAVLFIGEAIDRQREPTPGQDGHQTVVTEGTDQAIERHRREVADHRAPFQTERLSENQPLINQMVRNC